MQTEKTIIVDPNTGKDLCNKLGREQLLKRLKAENFKRMTISFYRYVIIEKPEEVRDQLFAEWNELNCLGRIYLAKEGINTQMSLPEHHWSAFVKQLYAHPEFKDVPFNLAVEDDGKSFLELTVKVRSKIVADGLDDSSFNVANVGKHLTAREWNEAIDRDKAIVVDIRNLYESEIGHFEGAILAESETFREGLPEVLNLLKGKENQEILLYCTGGIRCEKTSAFLKHHGFMDVNQLQGGIVDYARQIKAHRLPNKFKGKNFVFDSRLGESISDEVIAHCYQCCKLCDTYVNCVNKECNLLFIQCSDCAEKWKGTCSPKCKEVCHLSEEKQKRRESRKTVL